MTHLLSIITEAAILTGVICGLYLIALIFRSPFHARWLDIEQVGTMTAVAITALLNIAFSAFVSGLIGAGLNSWLALAGGLVFWLTVSYLLWAIFRMSARLKAAENGLSPFALDKVTGGHVINAPAAGPV